MLGVAFLLAAALWAQRPDADWKVSIALSGAALTTVPSCVLAIWLYAWFLLTSGTRWGRKRVLALSVFLLSCVVAALVIRPPEDSGSYLMRDQTLWPVRLANAVGSIAKAYLPIPGHPIGFWNVTLLSLGPDYVEVVAGVVVAALLVFFFRDRMQRAFFLAGSVSILLLGAYTARREMRHVGWLFIAFVLALLLMPPRRSTADATKYTGWRGWLLTCLLIIQVGSGLYATAISLVVPFSASLATVQFLRRQHLDQAPLVFSPGVAGLSVLSYLEHPSAFYPEFHGPGSYVVWNRDLLWNAHMPTALEMKTLGAGGQPVVLITEEPLTAEESQRLGVDLLASFDRAIAARFPYYVYRRLPR
jgi:hypothetical protein